MFSQVSICPQGEWVSQGVGMSRGKVSRSMSRGEGASIPGAVYFPGWVSQRGGGEYVQGVSILKGVSTHVPTPHLPPPDIGPGIPIPPHSLLLTVTKTCMVGKRVVCILLKCFLVYSSVLLTRVYSQISVVCTVSQKRKDNHINKIFHSKAFMCAVDAICKEMRGLNLSVLDLL